MADEQAQDLYIAVTGHRPDKLGGYVVPNPLYDLVVKGLYDAFTYYKPAYVITGMALGVDQWAAELCFNLGIPFVAALPFEGQDAKWPPQSKAKFHMLLEKAANKFIICQGGYAPWKMQERNKWMVRAAHMMVAVWNGTSGGTANCVGYAVDQKKFVHYVPLPPAGMPVGEFFQQTYGPHAKSSTETSKAQAPGGQTRIVEI
jgi:uncharacterized phage-like protein YoqJ